MWGYLWNVYFVTAAWFISTRMNLVNNKMQRPVLFSDPWQPIKKFRFKELVPVIGYCRLLHTIASFVMLLSKPINVWMCRWGEKGGHFPQPLLLSTWTGFRSSHHPEVYFLYSLEDYLLCFLNTEAIDIIWDDTVLEEAEFLLVLQFCPVCL